MMQGITRRDFVNGTLLTAGGAALSPLANASSVTGQDLNYPPGLTGMRGNHPASNKVAHNLAWGQSADLGIPSGRKEHYDLVIVGAGLSGLAAAYFYQRQYGAGSRILLLDNHDDFGGHAKRNEHLISGRRLISYGGSQTLVEPGLAPPGRDQLRLAWARPGLTQVQK